MDDLRRDLAALRGEEYTPNPPPFLMNQKRKTPVRTPRPVWMDSPSPQLWLASFCLCVALVVTQRVAWYWVVVLQVGAWFLEYCRAEWRRYNETL